jgi:phosphotransferase family enzyme
MASALDVLPAAARDAAERALVATFGAVPAEIVPLSGGASTAFVFRAGRHLLRLEGAHSPLRNPHQYQALRLAAEAGLAPPVRHLDEAAGILIADFIAQQPLRAYPGGPEALARAVGELAARLQVAPLFPAFVDYAEITGRLFAHVVRTGLFAPGLLDPHTARLAAIATRWKPTRLVSAHNDINPRNILFDGTRLWLIDFESAYRNDPLVDVAILLDNFAPNPALEAALLAAWRGEADPAHLADARALTRLYYAGVLLSASATIPRAAADTDLTAPVADEFIARYKAWSPETIHALGKLYLASFMSGDPVPPLDAL